MPEVQNLKIKPLDIVARITKAIKDDPARPIDLVGPWGAAKTLIAVQAAEALNASLLIVSHGRIEAEGIQDDLGTFAGEAATALLPAWEVLPTDRMGPADDVVAERMDTLKRLSAAMDRGKPMRAVVSIRALMQRVVARADLTSQNRRLEVGEEYDLEELLERLIAMGYRRELMVEQRGEMSLRGGLLDIFPISAELPYRIEFFGDEVESIRRFEPETQRSVEQVDHIDILPRSERQMLKAGVDGAQTLGDLTDYFPKDTLVVIDEPVAVDHEARNLDGQFAGNPYCIPYAAIREALAKFPQVAIAQMAHDRHADAVRMEESVHAVTGWTGNLAGFWDQLRQWQEEAFSVVLLCNNTGERNRLIELLEEQGYHLDKEPRLRVELGRLHAGFASLSDRLAILSEREIFGRHYVRRTRRRFEVGAGITSFSDLKAGDYIVHVIHGIGRYEGMRRFPGQAGDFMAVRYAGGDMLYVPVTQIDRIQKYEAGEDAKPKIDKLGGSTWARTRSRVKRAVKDMTEDLLKLYAARESLQGHPYPPDTPWQREFEDSFEYEETPDQDRAIADAKADMQGPKPMDRLICGDVGFGKTEVALRAAFKAVMDAKQVAVLVPTTILAQQHFTTFSERMADYPVRICMLSRFRTAKEQKADIERIRTGEVDIVVGTHRLVGKDIQFKDLGLVIIDEEQRFGVAHKEKLKQLRAQVDVLTMSATPIPRTLHLSLMGIRDMSVINTAPNDRLPIHTCIESFDEDLIREAIRRELAREGQIFFLHNRIRTIYGMADLIHKLVPEAKLVVAHGQMPEHELEEVMTAFIRHEYDVLLCTSIIGSGLDIPNANTIIVDRADRFGLAELYQVRGRVGRYKHRAFAYLLVPGDRVPTEDAQKRLKALEEFSALGAGFRIAMRDLEIRGCGNILGGEQHGNIASVGYETYYQLIQEAVAELKGDPVVHRMLPPFDIAIDAYIPEDYVPSEAQKMTLYRRIAGILTVEGASEMLDELKDRFGRPPAPVVRLVDVMRVRAHAADAGATAIAAAKEKVTVTFGASSRFNRRLASALKEQYGQAFQVEWSGAPTAELRLPPGADPLKSAQAFLTTMAETG